MSQCLQEHLQVSGLEIPLFKHERVLLTEAHVQKFKPISCYRRTRWTTRVRAALKTHPFGLGFTLEKVGKSIKIPRRLVVDHGYSINKQVLLLLLYPSSRLGVYQLFYLLAHVTQQICSHFNLWNCLHRLRHACTSVALHTHKPVYGCVYFSNYTCVKCQVDAQ